MRTLLTILFLLWATPSYAWMAVMDWTEDGRIAKYHKCEVEQDCIDHAQKFSDKYPDAFVVDEPAEGTFDQWRVDPVAEALLFQPDEDKLDQEIQQEIRSEGHDQLNAFMEDAQFEVGAGMYLTLKRAGGETWTAGEASMAANLLERFTYVRDLYVTARQAIQNIPNMTLQEKLDFDVKTDVNWPVAP